MYNMYIYTCIYNSAIKISIGNKLMSYNDGETRKSCYMRHRVEEVKAKFSVSNNWKFEKFQTPWLGIKILKVQVMDAWLILL